MLVSRRWLADTAHSARVQVQACHPETGALLGPDSTERYRPSTRVARRIRARDRRCRFPGCSIAAVYCDLDHVRPYPAGPTSQDNLICLCRRHHRIKQRPGWTVTLSTDGIATWTDPTGKARTTSPVDALTATILRGTRHAGTATPSTPSSTSRARTLIPDGPHTALEYHLEHHAAPPPGQQPAPPPTWRDDHGRHHGTDLLPQACTVAFYPDTWPHHHTRHPGRSGDEAVRG